MYDLGLNESVAIHIPVLTKESRTFPIRPAKQLGILPRNEDSADSAFRLVWPFMETVQQFFLRSARPLQSNMLHAKRKIQLHLTARILHRPNLKLTLSWLVGREGVELHSITNTNKYEVVVALLMSRLEGR
jgi:hypothetical protein